MRHRRATSTRPRRRRRKTLLLLRRYRWLLATTVVAGLSLLIGLSIRGVGRTSAAGLVAPDPAWVPPRPSDRWTCIVMHHSASAAGGAARFARDHRGRGWDGLGYHFVIGNGSDTPDGHVEVGPRWAAQTHGAHCRTPDDYYNAHGIGICLVGNFDAAHPTAAQARSLQRLVRYLCHAHRIPADRIYTHGGVTGKTRCPGANFDLAALRRAVERPE